MTAALSLGALFGLSVVAAWRLLRPPPPPLQAALDRLQRRPGAIAIQPVEDGGVISQRLGRGLRAVLEGFGVDLGGLGPELRVTGRSLDQHLGGKALLALTGLLLPPAWTALVAVGGVRVGTGLTLGAAVVFAVAGFVVPDLLLRVHAGERRRDFSTALGSYLDLVVISLAGGSGVESSLRDAAHIGHGWAFTHLRGAIEATRLTGESPWSAFARLAADLGVAPLAELAASVSLAGTEGARVRDSLAAKAASLRDRQLSEAEADAQSATERMAVPTVLLLAGFMVLIGYPAVDAVLTGL